MPTITDAAPALAPNNSQPAPYPLEMMGPNAVYSSAVGIRAFIRDVQGQHGIPTISQFEEARHVLGGLKPHHRHNIEDDTVETSHYIAQDGSEVPLSVYSRLQSISNPIRWVQDSQTEELLTMVSDKLRMKGWPAADRTAPQKKGEELEPTVEEVREAAMPHIRALTKQVGADGTELSADDLDRLAALSRHARGELISQGVDVDELLRERSRVRASAKTPHQAFRGSDDDTVWIPAVGSARGRAIVRSREPNKSAYAEYVRPEEIALGWFLSRGMGKKTVMPTLKSLITGGTISHSFNRRGAAKRSVNELTDEQVALGKRVARQLGLVESMERRASKTGHIPTSQEAASQLGLNVQDSDAPDTTTLTFVMDRLTAAASHYKPQEKRNHPSKYRVGIATLRTATRQGTARLRERLRPGSVRAATTAGPMVISQLVERH